MDCGYEWWCETFDFGLVDSSLSNACETNFRVAAKKLSEKFYSEKMKKILKLFFNLGGRACEPTESAMPVS